MNTVKKWTKLLLFALVLVLLLSAVAYADAPAPKYIYWQHGSGFTQTVRMVDYEEAIELLGEDPSIPDLYNATRDAVMEALARSRKVWIEVQIDDTWYIIDYSAVVSDGNNYTWIIDQLSDDPDQQFLDDYTTTRPDVDHEIYWDEATTSVKTRTPQPLPPREHPHWLAYIEEEEEYIRVIEEETFAFWVVEIEIEQANLPGGAKLHDIKEVQITLSFGDDEETYTKPAYRVPGERIWRAVFPFVYDEDEELLDPPVLDYGGVRILIGFKWYE